MSSPVKAREWEKSLTVKCRLCGGAKCKRCSESAALAKTDSPVHGLHADLVADRMLGMMRPSSRLMKEYQIASQFHKLGIAAVFNLTLPGEHPYCGDGLGSSGFPYDPENDLMAEKIHFYNFGWEDMTTPTLPFMLDIVKVMASVLQDGHNKLAVHCHAGYGRTGLAIACCLIFMHNIPPDRAIKIVRRDRPGSIQTSGQSKFVRLFHEYINASKVVFALPLIHDRFSVADMVEQQNRMVHGDKCAGAQLALPRVLDFLCHEVEMAVEQSAAAVVHAFVFHLLWHGHEGRRSTCDITERYAKHGRAIFGEHYASETDAAFAALTVPATIGAGGVMPPPPVPASLAPSPHCISQEDLFPVKVAFNVGEWNWNDAIALSPPSARGAYVSALLLDWLEHLAEPLIEADLVAQVATAAEDSAATKWKPLNQQPSCIFRSLNRVLVCLRHLLRKADALPTLQPGASLSDAVFVRAAMALFHLTTATPVATLCKHADFVKQLTREWQPPKRLELNFESLHKLTKSLSARKLHAHSPSTKHAQDTDSGSVCPATPPASLSPSRCSSDPVVLEPVVHPKPHAAAPTEHSPASPKAISPLKQSLDPSPHSPLHQPRPPPVELPPMAREKEERAAEPSPVKMESLVPRLALTDLRKDVEAAASTSQPTTTTATSSSGNHHVHHGERDGAPLIPTPPPPAGPSSPAPPSADPPDRGALHASASTPSHPTAPPPLTRGPGSGGNVYTLPSVKVGDRYKNRLP